MVEEIGTNLSFFFLLYSVFFRRIDAEFINRYFGMSETDQTDLPISFIREKDKTEAYSPNCKRVFWFVLYLLEVFIFV